MQSNHFLCGFVTLAVLSMSSPSVTTVTVTEEAGGGNYFHLNTKHGILRNNLQHVKEDRALHQIANEAPSK